MKSPAHWQCFWLLLFLMLGCFSVSAQRISNSKLSAHLIYNYTPGNSNIIAGHPRVLKILDVGSGMVDSMRAYKAGTPGGKVVLRVYSSHMYDLDNDPNASVAATNFWTTILQPAVNSLSPSDRALIDYLEGPNEGQTPTLGYPSDRAMQASAWFNQFWTNLTPMIVAGGFKPCIGSIAVGNPGGSPSEMQSYLAAFVPALRQAKAVGGAWSYHAYTIQYTTDESVEFYYSLRYRQFYSYFAQAFPDLNDMPMILTEGGVDATGDPNTSGWIARGPASWYQRWLNWFDRQLNQDSYVVGCTLFQNGDATGWASFELEPIASWLRNYLTNPTNVPPAPTGLTVALGNNQISVTWTSTPTNPCFFNVKRSTVSGGPYTLIASNITTGVANYGFVDAAVTNGGTYYYVVSAVNAIGEGPNSSEATPPIIVPSKINCGGPAMGGFIEDIYFSGGQAYATTNAIDTNGLVNPAPMNVYQSQRYQNLTYALPFLTPNCSYKLRLHFAEVYWTSPGQRVFNVLVNGAPVLNNFDIVVAAGGAFKGNIQEINAISAASGFIYLQLETVTDQASINGIEVIANPTNAIPSAPTGLLATTVPGKVSLSWSAPAGATSFKVKRATVNDGPYTVIASNLIASAFVDYSFTPNTTYYYVVSAQNALGESANSAQISATPTQGLPDVVITSLAWSPNPAFGGAGVTFRATVKNQGSVATPAGTVLGVGFSVDGAGVTFSGNYSAALAPGASVTLTANGGSSPNGSWPSIKGKHTLTGNVDDVNRFAEANEGNNLFSTNLSIFPTGYAVNSGGTASGSFLADDYYNGGSSVSTTSNIDVSFVSNLAAPQAVYRSERSGDFSYTFSDLIPGQTYAARLHFAELVYTNAGERLFNVSLNGNQALTNFDIAAQAGGARKAIIKRFHVPAKANGEVSVQFSSIVGEAECNGVEILSTNGIVNGTPVLFQPSNAVVNANSLLTFTARAIDPDQPLQTLTYSLVAGAPAGASVDPVSGLFMWTPTLAQSPSTNNIQVRVSDNHSPAGSSMKSFSVIVVAPPRISQFTTSSGGDLSITFESFAGKNYRVQYKNDLNDSAWLDLGSDVLASSSSTVFTHPGSTNAQGFYRVVQLN